MEFTKLATIDRTFERANAEGLGVSRHFIRQAVNDGRLPCVRAGKKALINWDLFLAFLATPSTPEQAVKVASEIRAVPV